MERIFSVKTPLLKEETRQGWLPTLFRLPLLWLFLGPPVFRIQEARGTMASMQGSFDFWNFFQAFWWLGFGMIAISELYRQRHLAAEFVRWAGSIKWWVGLWLVPMYVSCLGSPSLVFSLGNVVMLTILVIAALDFGVKLYRGVITPRAVLRILFVMTLGLLFLVALAFMLQPGLVEQTESAQGLRIRGGQVGYSPLLGSVALLLSFYFWCTEKYGPWVLLGVMGLGGVFLLLGQTRAEYGAFFAGVLLFGWQWGRLRRRSLLLLSVGAVTVALFCIAVLLGSASETAVSMYESIGERLMRGGEYLATLNGRTRVWELLWEASKNDLWGMGFAAGPRELLMEPATTEYLYSDTWGNAHSAYIEVFSGSGYLAAIGFLGIIACVGWKALFGWATLPRLRGEWWALVPLHALLLVTLVEGLTESYLVLPFRQQSVLFWITAAAVIAGYARRRRDRSRANRSAAIKPTSRRPYETVYFRT